MGSIDWLHVTSSTKVGSIDGQAHRKGPGASLVLICEHENFHASHM